MYSDLFNVLPFSSQKLPHGQTFLCRQDDLADCNFMQMHFISMFLRGSANVVIFSFDRNIAHYSIILTKLGVSFQRCLDQGQAKFFDYAEHFASSLFENLFQSGGSTVVESLFEKIFADVTESLRSFASSNKPLLVMIDSLTWPLYLGMNAGNVVSFVVKLKQTCLSANSPLDNVCILMGSDCKRGERCHGDLHVGLEYFADWVLTVERLPSGLNRDVHGQVLLQDLSDYSTCPIINKLLFRLSERNVQFMPSGLSTGML